MTIRDCYQAMGGDYEQAVRRLSGEKMVERFLARFLEDDSFPRLCGAMEERKRKEAFYAADALKDVSGNSPLSGSLIPRLRWQKCSGRNPMPSPMERGS